MGESILPAITEISQDDEIDEVGAEEAETSDEETDKDEDEVIIEKKEANKDEVTIQDNVIEEEANIKDTIMSNLEETF